MYHTGICGLANWNSTPNYHQHNFWWWFSLWRKHRLIINPLLLWCQRCFMIYWLIDYVIDWMIDWSTDRSTGWLAGWLIDICHEIPSTNINIQQINTVHNLIIINCKIRINRANKIEITKLSVSNDSQITQERTCSASDRHPKSLLRSHS